MSAFSFDPKSFSFEYSLPYPQIGWNPPLTRDSPVQLHIANNSSTGHMGSLDRGKSFCHLQTRNEQCAWILPFPKYSSTHSQKTLPILSLKPLSVNRLSSLPTPRPLLQVSWSLPWSPEGVYIPSTYRTITKKGLESVSTSPMYCWIVI